MANPLQDSTETSNSPHKWLSTGKKIKNMVLTIEVFTHLFQIKETCAALQITDVNLFHYLLP